MSRPGIQYIEYLKIIERENLPDTIITIISMHKGIKKRLIISKSKKRPITDARKLIAATLYLYTNLSLMDVGWETGITSHASIIYALRIVGKGMPLQKEFAEIQKIMDNLNIEQKKHNKYG